MESVNWVVVSVVTPQQLLATVPVVEAQALEEATLDAPTIVMDGLTASVRCPPGGAPLPASIPSPEEDPPRSSPIIPTVPMFPQDARDVMMSAPKEMENRISWTTDQEEAIQAALEVHNRQCHLLMALSYIAYWFLYC